jgi:hypothetical protein
MSLGVEGVKTVLVRFAAGKGLDQSLGSTSRDEMRSSHEK